MGIYTFLYTDIEGSTRLWETQPEAMHTAVERHDFILKKAIDLQGGHVFRTAGDAFCAVFPSALSAASAALSAQRGLYAEDWALDSPLRVRMVLHTTDAEESGGDYIGSGLNRIGRLLEICHGGQILATYATQALLGSQLSPEARLIDLGSHRLRDLALAEPVFQLAANGLPENFLPLNSLDQIPHNLPVQLTSFIGRERELGQVKKLMETAHLLTLTGPGGVGKSRLALQTAAEVMPEYPHGAWLIELAPVADPKNILPAIASVLKIREIMNVPLQTAIIDYLQRKKILLILDNCEHLIDACAQITTVLLIACPDLRLIVSSREPLGIAGEAAFRIPSLSLPVEETPLDVKAALKFEAVELFVQRAQSMHPNFTLQSKDLFDVIRICRRLDGIPLAIELAAARIQLFSPREIVSRLDQRFRLLTGGSRTALPRQQTLHALIDWSYELLTPEERIYFRKLSVFAGGWTFAAAEAVCGEEVLDGLASLVNKSLVIAEEDPRERANRFRFLETIRDFAAARLLEVDDPIPVRDHHLAYYAEFVREADRELNKPEQSLWIHRLDLEQENLRRALEWASERDPDLGLEMAGELAFYWARRGYASEGKYWLRSLLKRVNALPPEDGAAQIRRRQAQASAHLGLGELAVLEGRYPDARQDLEHSVVLYRQVNNPNSLSYAIGMLGMVQTLMGNLDEGRRAAEESLELSEGIEDSLGYPVATASLGLLEGIIGEHLDVALERANKALQRMRAVGNEWFAATAVYGIGLILVTRNELELGRRHLLESQQIFIEMGDRQFINITRSALADVSRKEGDYPAAIAGYLETADEWKFLGNVGAVSRCLECVAFIRRCQAQEAGGLQKLEFLRQAARLLGAASSMREAAQSQMSADEVPEFEQELELLKSAAGEVFGPAWEEGQGMNLVRALAYAHTLVEESS